MSGKQRGSGERREYAVRAVDDAHAKRIAELYGLEEIEVRRADDGGPDGPGGSRDGPARE